MAAVVVFPCAPETTIARAAEKVQDKAKRMQTCLKVTYPDIWSPIAIGALADATGNLTAGMLLTVVAIGGGGVLFLRGMRYLEQDQRGKTSAVNLQAA